MFQSFDCGHAGAPPLVEQIDPRTYSFVSPVLILSVSFAEPLSDGDTNTPASVVKRWWGDKYRHRNTQKEYIYAYIYDELLSVSVYQIHSQGFGRPGAT